MKKNLVFYLLDDVIPHDEVLCLLDRVSAGVRGRQELEDEFEDSDGVLVIGRHQGVQAGGYRVLQVSKPISLQERREERNYCCLFLITLLF